MRLTFRVTGIVHAGEIGQQPEYRHAGRVPHIFRQIPHKFSTPTDRDYSRGKYLVPINACYPHAVLVPLSRHCFQ